MHFDLTVSRSTWGFLMANPQEASEPGKHTVPGLDTIRFLAAMFVVFGHGALFPIYAYIPKEGIWRLLGGIHGQLV
ncbi:MAG: hypothetical protein WDN48_03840 [Pseudolabrys sp.]